MIKFTFDILKVIRETKNFSKNKIINKICRYDSNLFLHQSEIFAKLNGDKNRISEISKKVFVYLHLYTILFQFYLIIQKITI